MINPFRRGHKPDVEALSALADGSMPPGEMSALREHLATCEACTQTFTALSEARTLLRAQPQAEAPRSFRLRVADVEAPVPAAPARTPLWGRLAPAMGGVAAIVLVVAVGADIGTSGGGSVAQLPAQREDRTGMLAADAEASPESAYESYAPATGGEVAGPAGEPTGAPPDGDGTVPSTGDAAAGAFPRDDAAGTIPAPLPVETPASGAIEPEQGKELIDAFAEEGDSDEGNRMALRVVEIVAASAMLIAGVAYLAGRRRRTA